MAVDGLPRLAIRRWYVTLTGLVITAVLCGAAYKAVPATYQAKADVLVLPAQKSVGAGGNPYLELGGIQQAAEVLANAMSDTAAADAVQASGGSGTYSVVIDPRTSAPLLLITGKGRTPAIALNTLTSIINVANPTLLRLQQAINVPAGYLITTKVVTVDVKASPVRKSQVRAVIAAGVLGVLLTLLMLVLISRLLERRRARRRPSDTDGQGSAPAQAPLARLLPGQEPASAIGISYAVERQAVAGRQSHGLSDLDDYESEAEGVGGPLRRG